ncbi:hypothetical protein C8J56DRAFT_1163632 [Mycena floridula]|nr:hypothetical protein C8J56DRAFT_1163632 [Mycena floridula]
MLLLFPLFITAGAFSLVLAQDAFDWPSLKPSDAFTWTSCYSDFQCSRLIVPLNYSEPEGEKAVIAVIRLPSPLEGTSTFRGPLIINPGGPGGSGVDVLVLSGRRLPLVLGPQFEFMSFDPRGVSRSTPAVSFFRSDADLASTDFSARGMDANSISPSIDIPRLWAQAQVLGHLAKDRDDTGILSHVTTDNVARDMLEIVRASNETQIQYYGISYGSVLGATFATLFPDKVKRMVLDGKPIRVLDMEAWFTTDISRLALDIDKDLQTFFDGCYKAGPNACAFYAKSPRVIKKNFYAIVKSVRAQPVAVYNDSQYGIVDYSMLQLAVDEALYSPYDQFSTLARGLADLRDRGDGTVIFKLGGGSTFGPTCKATIDNGWQASLAIGCGDAVQNRDTPAELKKYYYQNRHLSPFFMGHFLPERIICSGWQVNTPNHFTGPVGGNTSFPLLLIGNSADPTTPFAGAVKTSKAFKGSVVLKQDSPGVSLILHQSPASQRLLTAYLIGCHIILHTGVLQVLLSRRKIAPEKYCLFRGSGTIRGDRGEVACPTFGNTKTSLALKQVVY